MKKKNNLVIFSIGGIGYGMIEILWRRYTHWTMVLTGGTCFSILYRIFRKIRKAPIWKKCVIGSSVITGIEFCVGCIVNLWGKMKVWDYSRQPMNLCGQICLAYSLLWGILTIPISLVCSLLRKKLERGILFR